MKRYFIYMMTNWADTTLYTGITNDIERRVWEHKNKALKGFTKQYNLNKLVYLEETSDVHAALAREKQIKGWKREKKNALVESINQKWRDLAEA